MRTVPEATKTIIERSRYLVEAISKGLINYSSLARYIRPEVEKMLVKDVSEASILMAIKRFEETLKTPKYENVFHTTPDMTFHSSLCMITLPNTESLNTHIPNIFHLSSSHAKYFLTITHGIFETTIIASTELLPELHAILKTESYATTENLSSITIRLPETAIHTPGVYYFFLKSIAWEGINILDIVSSHLELTILFKAEDINNAFSIVRSLFSGKDK